MANWVKADLSAKVLEYIGQKPAAQAASSEDDILCQAVIDSVFSQLDKLGLVTFASSAIPEWAQWPLVKYVAAEVGPSFGVTGQPLAELEMGQAKARRELQEQTAGQRQHTPGKAEYF